MTRFRCFTITPLAMLMAVAFGWTCPTATAQIACRYEVAAIITVPPCGLGERQVYATAISPNGRYVCGYYCQCLCTAYESFVFDMDTKQMFTIPRGPGMFNSRANDVSDAGVVVGFVGGNPGDFGYIYDYPTQTYLQLLSSTVVNGTCQITGINASSVVCGTRTISGPPNYESSAFTWSAKGGITDLGLINNRSTSLADINNPGIAVGGLTRDNGNLSVAFAWDGVTLTTLPLMAGYSTTALEIKHEGTVIGVGKLASPPISPTRGFSLRGGVMTIHHPLPGFGSSTAFDKSSEGLIIGSSIPASGGVVPTIWRGEAPTRFDQLLVDTAIPVSLLVSCSDTGLLLAASITRAVVLRPVYLVADLNHDCRVGVADLIALIVAWGQTNSPADLDQNGVVNAEDLLIVIINWT